MINNNNLDSLCICNPYFYLLIFIFYFPLLGFVFKVIIIFTRLNICLSNNLCIIHVTWELCFNIKRLIKCTNYLLKKTGYPPYIKYYHIYHRSMFEIEGGDHASVDLQLYVLMSSNRIIHPLPLKLYTYSYNIIQYTNTRA